MDGMPIGEMWAFMAQYGILGLVLFFLGILAWRGGIWMGHHILLPIANAHITFLTESTSAMKQMREELKLVAECEGEIKRTARAVEDVQKDPDAMSSTVHTNGALHVLSRALILIAEKHGVDLKELHGELESILRRQRRI